MSKRANPTQAEILTTSAEQAKFSRIYFDSSSLLQHKWPQPAPSFRNLLSLAHSIDVPCLIPEPVLLELEAGWMRAFADAQEKFQEHLNTVIENPQMTKGRDALEAYREQVVKLVNMFHLSRAPFTNRPLDQIFAMVARRDAPFAVAAGFRDGVIQLSVQDDMATHPEEVAAIVSNDGPFHAQCKLLFAREGAKIEQFDDLSILRKALDARLSRIAAAAMEEDRARLTSAIQEENTWRKVREFIVENLRVQAGPSVKEIKDIGEIKLKSVEAPYPPKREESQSVEVSMEVEVPVLVTVLEYVAAEQEIEQKPLLRIGDRNPTATAAGGGIDWGTIVIPARPGTLTEKDEFQPIDLRLQASAIFEKGHYKDVKLTKLDGAPHKNQLIKWMSPTLPTLSNLTTFDNVTFVND